MDSHNTLGDFAVQVIDHIDPSETPQTLYHHYSLPNFDAGKRPQLEIGMSIKSGKLRVPDGTVLLSKLNPGSPKVWRISKAMGQHAIASTEFLVLKPRTGITLNALYAACLNPSFLRSVAAKATGTSSSHQRVRPSDLLATNLNLGVANADLAQIGDFISALDDKIELNRRMNATLEAMARALFQSWFVDFDPVRAKAEGRQPVGMDADTAALFPDSFEDSALGPIPTGWRTAAVKDIGDVVTGKTPSTADARNFGDDVPFITIPDMHNKVFATSTARRLSTFGVQTQPNKSLPAGTLCVSCIATPGLVVITVGIAQTNQQINAVLPNRPEETYYWFWVLKTLGAEIASHGSGGSVLSNLSKGRFESLAVIKPPPRLIQEYSKMVKPAFEMIRAIALECESLAVARDTLLPQLLSGELRVGDVPA